jgi:response regulator RpfG family c-di-GMP phosphodiesterase
MLSQYKILCVDDETANLRLLERLFRDSYEVFTAASGAEGIALLEVHDFALILSDQRMPGMTGIEFLKKTAEMRRQTVRLMLTGYTDAGTLVEAINSGIVYKYVTKPWSNDDLAATVKRALQHYETMKGQRQLQLQNERLQARISSMQDAYVKTISQMRHMQDPLARGHAERTRNFAYSIGEALRMDREEIDVLSLAAYLHETPLIGEDRDAGLAILERNPELEEIASILRFQDEHFDGSGRPNRLAGQQIPLQSRIVAVAKAFADMTDPRRSDSPRSVENAIGLIEDGAGKQFDPAVVEILARTQAPVSSVLVPEMELAAA